MPDPLGDFSYTWPFLLGFVLAYLIGSVPFGLVLARMAGLGDVRRMGSGNIGATNVLRTGHRGLAAATLLLDAGKGALAVAIAWGFGPGMAALAALGAVLGHVAPVWLGFRGGKGVATAIGVHLVYAWPLGAAVAGLWVATALLFRFSSLASVTAFAASPVIAWVAGGMAAVEVAGPIAAVVLLRHIGNIRRLLRGEESRIGGS